MNLTDLRDELTTHADDLGTAPDFSAGVAGRVRTTRRRRAVAAGSVAALTVAALTVGVVTSLGRPAPTVPAGSPSSAAPMIGADGMPFRSVPDAPGDVVKDGLRYRAEVADDTLVAGFIGDRGQGQFSLLWEPTTTHVSVGAECWLPGLTAEKASAYMVSVSLRGTPGFFGSSCTGGRPQLRDLPAGGTVPGEPGQGWSELTVGRAASVRIQLVDATTNKPAAVDGAQLTGAIYELGPQATMKDLSGKPVAAIPEVREHAGYRYRLTASVAGPLDVAGAPQETAAPASGPFLVTYGTAATGSPRREPAYFQLEGLVGEQTQTQEGGSETTAQRSGDGRPLRLEVAEGSAPPGGTGYIAIYTPEP
ncbi:hypothetical protein LJR027_000066 [Terrabacter sp. LjRoot27]|uniref:hypothetical protein n=1 Tax=Terrabacter sp. LjRoot27 TaxID=3342306 RepID=UPI003ECF9AD6